jgi:hypothetical protein
VRTLLKIIDDDASSAPRSLPTRDTFCVAEPPSSAGRTSTNGVSGPRDATATDAVGLVAELALDAGWFVGEAALAAAERTADATGLDVAVPPQAAMAAARKRALAIRVADRVEMSMVV